MNAAMGRCHPLTRTQQPVPPVPFPTRCTCMSMGFSRGVAGAEVLRSLMYGSESARGLAQSKTLRAARIARNWRQLLDCASPLALWGLDYAVMECARRRNLLRDDLYLASRGTVVEFHSRRRRWKR